MACRSPAAKFDGTDAEHTAGAAQTWLHLQSFPEASRQEVGAPRQEVVVSRQERLHYGLALDQDTQSSLLQ